MNRLHHFIGACCTSRLAAVAAFLALAGLSAGLARTAAQTVQGLDLDAIKARGSEQTREVQDFVDALAGREAPHERDAETLREEAIAAMQRVDPASLPKGPAGPVDFDAILEGAASNASAPT